MFDVHFFRYSSLQLRLFLFSSFFPTTHHSQLIHLIRHYFCRVGLCPTRLLAPGFTGGKSQCAYATKKNMAVPLFPAPFNYCKACGDVAPLSFCSCNSFSSSSTISGCSLATLFFSCTSSSILKRLFLTSFHEPLRMENLPP